MPIACTTGTSTANEDHIAGIKMSMMKRKQAASPIPVAPQLAILVMETKAVRFLPDGPTSILSKSLS